MRSRSSRCVNSHRERVMAPRKDQGVHGRTQQEYRRIKHQCYAVNGPRLLVAGTWVVESLRRRHCVACPNDGLFLRLCRTIFTKNPFEGIEHVV
jgi:hypothetical protein